VGAGETRLFPETWRPLSQYPGFGVAPWTPEAPLRRVVFCSACLRLWLLLYSKHDDFFSTIQELPPSILPLLGAQATAEAMVACLFTGDYLPNRICLASVTRQFFMEGEYDPQTTVPTILRALERTEAVEQAQELIGWLRQIVGRLNMEKESPLARHDPGEYTLEAFWETMAKIPEPGKGPVSPVKLVVEDLQAVWKVFQRPELYGGLAPEAAAYAKKKLWDTLRDLARNAFPPKGDVARFPPLDKQRLLRLLDDKARLQAGFEALGRMNDPFSEIPPGELLDIVVPMYDWIANDAPLSVLRTDVLISLLERLQPQRFLGDAKDAANAAFHHTRRILEKAYAYDLLPPSRRRKARAMLNAPLRKGDSSEKT